MTRVRNPSEALGQSARDACRAAGRAFLARRAFDAERFAFGLFRGTRALLGFEDEMAPFVAVDAAGGAVFSVCICKGDAPLEDVGILLDARRGRLGRRDAEDVGAKLFDEGLGVADLGAAASFPAADEGLD